MVCSPLDGPYKHKKITVRVSICIFCTIANLRKSDPFTQINIQFQSDRKIKLQFLELSVLNTKTLSASSDRGDTEKNVWLIRRSWVLKHLQ